MVFRFEQESAASLGSAKAEEKRIRARAPRAALTQRGKTRQDTENQRLTQKKALDLV